MRRSSPAGAAALGSSTVVEDGSPATWGMDTDVVVDVTTSVGVPLSGAVWVGTSVAGVIVTLPVESTPAVLVMLAAGESATTPAGGTTVNGMTVSIPSPDAAATTRCKPAPSQRSPIG